MSPVPFRIAHAFSSAARRHFGATRTQGRLPSQRSASLFHWTSFGSCRANTSRRFTPVTTCSMNHGFVRFDH